MMAINFSAPPEDPAPKKASKPVEHAQEVRDHDLDLSQIKLDQSAQPREHLNTEKTAEYAAAMKAGDQFPPLVVFHDGVTYWLADGFHRHYAAQQAGRKHIRCYVRQGGLRDAILWSVGANANHGLARSDEDKRRAVLRLINDEEWAAWSDREIARRCAVGNKLVGDVRRSVTVSEHSERTYQTKHGTTATMKTAGINASRKNAPEGPRLNDEPSPEVGPQAEASHVGTDTGTPADREGRREGEAVSADLPTAPRILLDEFVSLWCEANSDDREGILGYLRINGFIPSSNPEQADVDRSAERASSAVEVGATNSPERAKRSGAVQRPAQKIEEGLKEALAVAKGEAEPHRWYPAIHSNSAVTPPAADKTGAAPLPSSAAPVNLHPDRATPADADGHPSKPNPEAARAKSGGAANAVIDQDDIVQSNSGQAVSKFINPRCLNACHFAHSQDACHDCLMAWSARPKDEQIRLWAEANEAARAAV